MISIDSLVNVFTQEDFIPDPYGRKKNGVLLSVLKDVGMIYTKLRSLGVPYKWECATAGRTERGAYFVGNLTVLLNGVEYTVPGAAETPEGTQIGLAGVEALALQNGALRGLGMAEWLYVNNKVADAKAETKTAPATQITQATPTTTTQTPAQAKAGYQRQRTAFKKSAPTGQATPVQQTTGTWTGKEICPFGKHKDQAYETIPTEYLNWASAKERPDEGAKKELARRVAENPPDTTVPDGAGFDWVQ